MTLAQIVKILDGDFLSSRDHRQKQVHTGCGCDLMSDVLAFIKPNALLLTGLTNAQVIRTAEMADVKAICFVRGKKPGGEVIALADEKDIALLATSLPLFEACGRLYREGLAGCSEYEG
ncbi:MAG: DRTGG domain-containing protein [Candidatus Neomarinimicrobiota bacterium]